MASFAFVFDGTRCTGCKTCVLACKDARDLPVGVAYRQVYEYEAGGWERDANGCWVCASSTYYVSLACNHCADPACVRVCPTGAIHANEDGFVVVDTKRCVGCGYCALSCPYHAPQLDAHAGHSVKCDGCADRVAAGGMPVCVEACPQRALGFGDYLEMTELWGDGDDFAPLPPSSYTRPSLIAVPPHHALPCDDTTGRIVNGTELV